MAIVSAVTESNDDGTILFAFAFPGACGWGPTNADARQRLRSSLQRTLDWLAGHDLEHLAPTVDPDDATVEITQRVPATGDPLDCDTEGFFDFDRTAYTDDEVARTRTLLEHTRADLMDTVAESSASQLDYRLVADRRTVREVLDHVAIAEHWYLTRIEPPVDVPASWRDYAEDTFERLAETRSDVARVLDALPTVPDDRRNRTWTHDAERWSYRKLLRRLVWHERLHFNQLCRLIPKVEAADE